MLRAEDFIKCQESRRLEIEKQKKAEKEQLFKDQLELVDKQLSEAYGNISKGTDVDFKYVEIQENLLPETIVELNTLGYYVEKSYDNIIRLYFEKPEKEKIPSCISTPQWLKEINQINVKSEENKGKVYSTEDIPKEEREPMTIKYESNNTNGDKKESLKINGKELDLNKIEEKEQNLVDELFKSIFGYYI